MAVRRLRVWPVVLSLLVTFIVASGLSLHFVPDVYRWSRLRMVRSDDPEARVEGLVYVMNHLDDPAVRQGCKDILQTADRASVDHLIAVLRRFGQWDSRFGQPWLDDLNRRLDDYADDADARAMVAVDLGEAGWRRNELVKSSAFGRTLDRLRADGEAVVRYNALKALAATGRATVNDYVAAADDDEPAVAKLAWLLAGLAAGGEDTAPNTGEATALPGAAEVERLSPSVGQTYLWADARFNAPRHGVAYAIATDADAPEALRAFAPYVLGLSRQPDTQRLLRWIITEAHPPGADAPRFGRLGRWRAILAIDPHIAGSAGATITALGAFYAEAPDTEAADPLAAAAASRLMPLFATDERVREAIGPIAWTGRPGRPWRELAVYAGLPRRWGKLAATAAMPDLVRVHAVRAMGEPAMDDLFPAFGSDKPGVRHLACIAAIERFEPRLCHETAAQLLREYRDESRMSGALLAAVSKTDPQLLRDRLEHETVWVVRQHLLLGLMMMGERDDFAAQAIGLLSRPAMPQSTVLWAMMHHGEIAALDSLFTPFGADSGYARRQLDEQRFAVLLQRYVPAAPRFDVWADVRLGQFQVDIMRTWYLVQRPALRFNRAEHRFELTSP